MTRTRDGDAGIETELAIAARLIAGSREAVLVLDRDGQVLLVNDAAADLLTPRLKTSPRPGLDLPGLLAARPGARALLLRSLERVFAGEDHAELMVLGEPVELRISLFRPDAAILRLQPASSHPADADLPSQGARLLAALESFGMGIYRVELGAGVARWDGNLSRMFGLGESTGSGSMARFLRRIHAEDRPALAQAVRTARSRGGAFEGVFRLLLPDGGMRWLQHKSQLYLDAQGRPSHIAGACSDISALKEAERGRDQRETEIRLLADTLPALVWMRSAVTGELTYVNRRWTEFSGQDLATTRKGGWAREIHPDDLPQVRTRLADSRSRGEIMEAEFRLRRQCDGAWRWHLVRTVPGRDAQGRIIYWCGTATDIEDLVQARAKLEQVRAQLQRANKDLAMSLAQLEAIINGMTEGLAVFDAQGRLLTMNPAARRLYGVISGGTPSEARLMAVRDMTGAALPAPAWPLRRVLRGEVFSGQELRLERLDDGREWIASFGGAPVRDEEGRLRFALVTLRDVTARHQIQQALQSAVEVRDRFLSVASHELRTPLTTLTLQLQLARRRRRREPGADPGELDQVFQVCERQVRRLALLVDDLLDVSRIESGRLRFDIQPINLARLAEEVCNQFSVHLGEAGCELHRELDPAVEGAWDPVRLEQVLGNLLMNACKYAAGSRVTVKVAAVDGVACLSVTDSGPGVPSEHRLRIFERFERNAPDQAITGLGLGLYLARQIAHGLGGELDVEDAPGGGACFRLRLPLVLAQPVTVATGT